LRVATWAVLRVAWPPGSPRAVPPAAQSAVAAYSPGSRAGARRGSMTAAG
jgi:hypothetical protein